MTGFAPEVDAPVHAIRSQPPSDHLFQAGWPLIDKQANRALVTQSAADLDRVREVLIGAVAVTQRAGQPALSDGGGGVGEAALGDEDDGAVGGGLDRGAASCDAGSDNQHIGEQVSHSVGIEVRKMPTKIEGRCHGLVIVSEGAGRGDSSSAGQTRPRE